jgi:hypothetical protein
MAAGESFRDVTFRVAAFINTPTKQSLCVFMNKDGDSVQLSGSSNKPNGY